MQNHRTFDKNIREKLHDMELGGEFLGMTLKT